ncbi:BnaA05g32050D [Brassica napus]|uniref:BnaA05g32050D protein n=1 Tax=Brassica napus TaxID=3708 RepID=A0A078GQU6_BRANA|nr:BnaA05g32050D [Brassica napus]
MEADSSNLSREVTPEQDPVTERDEHQTRKRIRGSDSMVTEGASSGGLHQLLDQLQVITSPVLQFTDKWREIHEEYATLQSSLKKQAVRLDLKEKSLMERVVELEKKEEMLKDVEEREMKIGLLEKSLEEKAKDNDVKQYLKGKKVDEDKSRELEKAVKEIEAREKKLRLLDEAMKEKVIELEKKQKAFEGEQLVKAEEMELKRREMLAELEKKEKSFEVELKAKAEEMELKCKEKTAALEKKEKSFEMELKAKAEDMKVKEKQLEEKEKELELKQRELEDKLKEREKETNSACLASASASSPQQRDKACEEEEPERIKIVDSEFHDFKNTMSSFSVDKIWALYDPQDEMPRLYAKIKRINKSRLSLDVTWLDPKDDESVPIACGRFTHGRRETVSYLTFSHELKPIIHGRNISVNPKKGETWALFKNLGQQHKPPYRYDLVEVVVGFKDRQGVGVAYLGKVEGFVSVFKHSAKDRVVKRVIAPDEMQRFSHRVPSVRLSGDEKEGVPAGSFELDPAAVPSYILLGGEGA